MPFDPVTLIGGGLKLLGGLFGRKKSSPMTPAQSIMSTATGVTDAAKATGINRLTLLGASNATAGAGIEMGGGPSPLASLSVLGDIVEEGFGQEAEQRREHNKLQNELLRLEVDRSRSVLQTPTARAVNGVGPGQSSLGGNYVGTVARQESNVFGAPFYQDKSALTPGRPDQVRPQEHSSGVIHVDNAVTGPVSLLGIDGEPFMEYLQVPLVGGFQVMNNYARIVAEKYVVPFLKGDPNWKPPKADGPVSYKKPGSDNPSIPRIGIPYTN